MKAKFFPAALVLAVFAAPGYASLIGPVYPAPGGSSFSSAGSVGNNGGRTGFYTGIDLANVSDLYFGMTDVQNVYNSAFSGPTGDMAFLGYNAATGVATWQSTVNLVYANQQGVQQSFVTLFEMQIQPDDNLNQGILASGWLPMTTEAAAGITGGNPNESVYHVTGSSFQVWSEFVIAATGQGVDTAFNNNNNGQGSIFTNTSGGFWYSNPAPPPPPATPEPGTLGLIGFGLMSAAIFGRRVFAR
jgi:hypothetical protein